MKVTHSNSQEIAERIGRILNKSVNIMEECGIIVASTDSSRIGMLHDGARELIARNASEVDIYPEDNFSGSRNGINVPIRIEGRTLGVIGVTGNPNELRDIALVIGEMASIMFMKTELSIQKENNARQRRLFCDELLHNSNISENSNILQRAGELKLLIESIHAIAVFKILDPIPEQDLLLINDKLTLNLRTKLGDTVYIHHHNVGQKLAVFLNCNSESTAIEHITEILNSVSNESHVNIFCGISCDIENFTKISKAYSLAEKAMEIAAQIKTRKCLIYEKLELEIILSQLSASAIDNFKRNVWKTQDLHQIEHLIDFLNTYFESNGSLDLIANKLFIHKNTVQYKIKKVVELTSYDPRILSDSVILFLACKL